MADWRVDTLRGLGAPVTKKNIDFLSTWQRWEGGHTKNDARFNWLNTTASAPGAVREINSVGVKAFDSYQNGVGATIQTLNNGRYGDVVEALRSGDPYKAKPVRGLSTWLSGRPDSRHGIAYAGRVLGTPDLGRAPGKVATGSKAKVQSGGQSYGGGGMSPQQIADSTQGKTMFRQAIGGFMLARAAARREGRTPEGGIDQLVQLRDLYSRMGGVPEQGAGMGAEPPEVRAAKGGPPSVDEVIGKGGLQLPTQWDPTHVTDGLGWGTKSAIDIMSKPGTPVGAPEDGAVIYFKPEGAQGGGSMLFRANSGKEYWIGHIAGGLAPGTRVKRGQRIAAISPDHPRPHAHLDVRP